MNKYNYDLIGKVRKIPYKDFEMLKSMSRLALRFIVPFVLALSVFGYVVLHLVDHLMLRWFIHDLDGRAQFIARSLSEPLSKFMGQGDRTQVDLLFSQAILDEQLYALAVCEPLGLIRYQTNTLPSSLSCKDVKNANGFSTVLQLPDGLFHIWKRPLHFNHKYLGDLMVVHDVDFLEERNKDTRKIVFELFAGLTLVIALITLVVAYMSWKGWISNVRLMLQGERVKRKHEEYSPEIQPLVDDLNALIRSLNEEQRIREASTRWTPETLKQLLHDQLFGDEVLVVSNREPYIHMQKSQGGIEVLRPASGLITAVEPVMRACSGTWIAHGSGSADRETVDKMDHIAVPPSHPSYTLRRIWLSAEEEKGYYQGFANEGLWPLCHEAYVRPVFRNSDWDHYLEVNQRFANAVIEEARTENPVVLVQDYHFALLPELIRERLPQATIITFWHIPWPNPESFSICPWKDQILKGLLGSTILGFQTRFHCSNFLETVDRFVETRIERGQSAISYKGQLTMVEHYPISIHWPGEEEVSAWKTIPDCRRELRQKLNVSEDHQILLGVDRLDYTKGVVERFEAMARLLELHPEYVGKVSFLQVAAPTRSALEEYQGFEVRVRATAQRINERFGSENYSPICLRVEHHDMEDLIELYRACDICVVTSLHDGMNLVAKEFIAARDDEQGSLILSQFAGAARELREALIVNPYHIEQITEAIHTALKMPNAEQRERMRSLRAMVQNFNIYRWAGRMLLDASRLRQRERVAARIDAHNGHS